VRILQINASYKPAYVYGGPTMSVSKLCEVLVDHGEDVEVLTTLANGTQEFDFPSGEMTRIDKVPVRFFKRLTKDHSHFSPALLKYLYSSSNKIDLIHIHAWWNLVSILSCLIAIRKNTPVLLSPRGTLSPYSFKVGNVFVKKIIHRLVNRRLLRSCHFHVTSGKEKEDLLEIIAPKSVRVIPNFIQLPELTTVNRQATENPVLRLLFLSRIDAKKGLPILFEALAKVNFPYQLTIAGSGDGHYIRDLKILATKLKIEENISWIGHQDSPQKFRVLNAHDLLVLPSHDENFANVVIESLAMGTAVLLSTAVGLADYVKAKGYGWISKLNAEDFSHNLEKIYENRAALQQIRLSSPEKVRADFEEKHLIKEYLAMYKQIIEHEQLS
jgi:glycosyltransferase involved in cell wall biosynthesis